MSKIREIFNVDKMMYVCKIERDSQSWSGDKCHTRPPKWVQSSYLGRGTLYI